MGAFHKLWLTDNDENKFLSGEIINPKKIVLVAIEMNEPSAYVGEFILTRK